jgi:hypothetical protein
MKDVLFIYTNNEVVKQDGILVPPGKKFFGEFQFIPQNNNIKVLNLAIKMCNNLVQFM